MRIKHSEEALRRLEKMTPEEQARFPQLASVDGLEWQVGRQELCPRLCPNGCLPSTNTVTYGATPREMSRASSR